MNPTDISPDDFEVCPIKHGAACGLCGSTTYAHCDLDPKDLKPKSCDRCPKVDQLDHPAAAQDIL